MEQLFVYGTLRDAAVQRVLFGEIVHSRPAILRGWGIKQGNGGYLFIRPEIDGVIQGEILSMTEKQLERADQWEEVPLYLREKVSVNLVVTDPNVASYPEDVWVYSRRDAEGIDFNQAHGVSAHSPEHVLRELRNLVEEMEAKE
ncbi:MAG: gamma-glutamylcyclotransferase family protein [Akkermansiaceae bacterium]